jgi:hypothetical protein
MIMGRNLEKSSAPNIQKFGKLSVLFEGFHFL